MRGSPPGNTRYFGLAQLGTEKGLVPDGARWWGHDPARIQHSPGLAGTEVTKSGCPFGHSLAQCQDTGEIGQGALSNIGMQFDRKFLHTGIRDCHVYTHD